MLNPRNAHSEGLSIQAAFCLEVNKTATQLLQSNLEAMPVNSHSHNQLNCKLRCFIQNLFSKSSAYPPIQEFEEETN